MELVRGPTSGLAWRSVHVSLKGEETYPKCGRHHLGSWASAPLSLSFLTVVALWPVTPYSCHPMDSALLSWTKINLSCVLTFVEHFVTAMREVTRRTLCWAASARGVPSPTPWEGAALGSTTSVFWPHCSPVTSSSGESADTAAWVTSALRVVSHVWLCHHHCCFGQRQLRHCFVFTHACGWQLGLAHFTNSSVTLSFLQLWRRSWIVTKLELGDYASRTWFFCHFLT